jgi:GNAT superfamily N-acetyltransferase
VAFAVAGQMMSSGFALSDAVTEFATWTHNAPDGPHVEVTTDPVSAAMEAFFAEYDRAFTLPNEKESLDGFRRCLWLNGGESYARLSAEYGPFRELVLNLRAHAGGLLLGGANFIALAGNGGGTGCITVNLNYAFVRAGARGRGWLRRLLAAVIEEARACFVSPSGTPSPNALVFIEQNDPLRLSDADYARDTAHSGLDQVDRLRIWHRLGARLVDIDYRQPALSGDQSPDEGLLYGVLDPGKTSLSACLLHDHLAAFFGISVLKGGRLMQDSVARGVIESLGARCEVGARVDLLDPGPVLADFTELGAAFRGLSLTDVVRQRTLGQT